MPALVQTGWSPEGSGYPTALRQAQIQGMREAEREGMAWAKSCLEIPRVPLESSARARFPRTELCKFLSAASQRRIMDCSIKQKIFPATESFFKDGALSTMHCCPLLANTHKSKCAGRPPRVFVMSVRCQHPWREIPIWFQVFSLPFLATTSAFLSFWRFRSFYFFSQLGNSELWFIYLFPVKYKGPERLEGCMCVCGVCARGRRVDKAA